MLNITNHQESTNQNQNKTSFHNCKKSYHQKEPKQQMLAEDVEKREDLYNVGGNVNLCSHYGKHNMEVSQKKKKLKLELSHDNQQFHSWNSIPGYISKKPQNYSFKMIHAPQCS